jgi:hypothetical protein
MSTTDTSIFAAIPASLLERAQRATGDEGSNDDEHDVLVELIEILERAQKAAPITGRVVRHLHIVIVPRNVEDDTPNGSVATVYGATTDAPLGFAEGDSHAEAAAEAIYTVPFGEPDPEDFCVHGRPIGSDCDPCETGEDAIEGAGR